MPRREWSVITYLAGDNSLAPHAINSVMQMKRTGVGPKERVSAVALCDSGPSSPPQRYIVNSQSRGGADGLLLDEGQLIPWPRSRRRFLNFVDTGNPSSLESFVKWAARKCPAPHYMVILSGHSAGPDDDHFLPDNNSPTRQASGKSSLTIQELKSVLEKLAKTKQVPGGGRRSAMNGKLEILGLETCLMGTTEVYYELGELATLIVAAEGVFPSTGWPYDRILEDMLHSEQIEPEALAENIVKAVSRRYYDYSLAGQSVQLGALRCAKREQVKTAVSKLGKVLKEKLVDKKLRDAIVLSHWEAQSYKFDQYVDLYDFCSLLSERCNEESVVDACQGAKQAVLSAVVFSGHCGSAFQHSNGLSIYFPWSNVSDVYDKLEFVRLTEWGDFLKAYVEKTRRDPRIEPDQTDWRTLKGRVFNPKITNYFLESNVHSLPGTRFVEPANMGIIGKIKSMKNPPVKWSPEPWLLNGSD